MADLSAPLIRGAAPLMAEARHYHREQTKLGNGDMSRAIIKTQSAMIQRDTSRLARRPEGDVTDRTGRFLMLQKYQGRQLVEPIEGDTFKLNAVMWVVGSVIEDAASSHWIIEATKQ